MSVCSTCKAHARLLWLLLWLPWWGPLGTGCPVSQIQWPVSLNLIVLVLVLQECEPWSVCVPPSGIPSWRPTKLFPKTFFGLLNSFKTLLSIYPPSMFSISCTESWVAPSWSSHNTFLLVFLDIKVITAWLGVAGGAQEHRNHTEKNQSLSMSDCQVAAWSRRALRAVGRREKDRGRGGLKRGSEGVEHGQTREENVRKSTGVICNDTKTCYHHNLSEKKENSSQIKHLRWTIVLLCFCKTFSKNSLPRQNSRVPGAYRGVIRLLEWCTLGK